MQFKLSDILKADEDHGWLVARRYLRFLLKRARRVFAAFRLMTDDEFMTFYDCLPYRVQLCLGTWIDKDGLIPWYVRYCAKHGRRK